MSKQPQHAPLQQHWQRIIRAGLGLWERLLTMPISLTRGYLVLIVLVGLLAGGWLLTTRLTEHRLIQAIHQNPDTYQGYDDLFFFYSQQRWFKSRETTFQRLHTRYPDHLLPLVFSFWHTILYADLFQTPIDLQSGKQALHTTSSSTEGYTALARAFLDVQQPEYAQQAAAQAVMLAPDQPETAYVLGQTLKRNGAFAAARDWFRACTTLAAPDSPYQRYCLAELIPGTRTLTVTLQDDQMQIATSVTLTSDDEQLAPLLRHDRPALVAQQLAWGNTFIITSGPVRFRLRYAPASLTLSDDGQQAVVTAPPTTLRYDYLWVGTVANQPRPPATIEWLPLAAFTHPTTITAIAEATQIMTTTHPYTAIHDTAYHWRLDHTPQSGTPPGITIALDDIQQARLMLASLVGVTPLPDVILYAAPILLAIPLFLARRRRATPSAEQATSRWGVRFVRRVFHPHSLFSWVFDLTLLVMALPTVLYPLYLGLLEGSIWLHPYAYEAFVVVLGLLMVQLAISDWYPDTPGSPVLLHMGAVVFSCYLLPRFAYTMLGPLSLMLNALVYYLLLMRNWPWAQSLTRPLLHHWFPAQRHRIIDQIEELEYHHAIDQARQAHLLALARGNAQADAYEQTQAILDRQSQQHQQEHQHMRAHLQIPQDEAPRSMLFRLGPAYTPLDTSLVALAFGMLPYVLFLVLSSFQDEVRLTTIQDFLFTTIGVPWGPIYLCFFGYFYRSIWGHVGVTKGLVFGGVLVALGWLYHWMWQMDQMDAIALWGLSMRILVTFVFTGLMMDWMTTRFSWRLVRRSYDSSAVTTVLAIIGTACTTVITGIVTGTLSQMLSFALQATSESLGVPMPEGP